MQGRWAAAHAHLGSALDGLQAAIERSHKAQTGGNSGEGEGSGGAKLLSEPGGEHEAPVRSSSRKRIEAAAADEVVADTPGRVRHVVAKLSTIAKTCAPLLRTTFQCAHLRICAHSRAVPERTDGPNLPSSATDDLQQRAERIKLTPDGDHAPSAQRLGPKAVTHELLMLCQDIVKSLSPKLSGKAQKRLFAWLLADAMSVGRPMEKALADTVGTRFDRQADRVRSEMEAISGKAAQERADAENAVALAGLTADPKNERLLAELAAKHSAIIAGEEDQLDKLRREVYVNVGELNLEAQAEPVTPAVPTLLSTPVTGPVGPKLTEEWDAEQRAFAHWRAHGGMLPQELDECLGGEGVRMLQDHLSGAPDRTGDNILEVGIPLMLKFALKERARERAEHSKELQEMRRECERDVARAEACAADATRDAFNADDETESLREELAREKARNEQLMEVVVKACLK